MDNSDVATVGNVQAILALARSDSVFRIQTHPNFIELSSGSSTVGVLIIFSCLVRGHYTLCDHMWFPL